MVKMKWLVLLVFIIPFISTSVRADTKMKYNHLTYFDEYYKNSNYIGKYQVHINYDSNLKEIYCSVLVEVQGRDKVKKDKFFTGKYFDDYFQIIQELNFKKSPKPNSKKNDIQLSSIENTFKENRPENLTYDTNLYFVENKKYTSFRWGSNYTYIHSEYEFEDNNNRQKLLQYIYKLAKLTEEYDQPKNQVYTHKWKKIVVDRRDINFGRLNWAKTMTIAIDYEKHRLVCTFISLNENGKELIKVKSFDKKYYSDLRMILKEVTVKDRIKQKDEARIAWDAGILETISICKGEHKCYTMYFEEAPYKTDYVIRGKTEELLAFIDKLRELTEKG